MAVPGNAYVTQTGGTFTAPTGPAAVATSTTAKTVLAITTGSSNQPAITEFGISSDGTSGTLLVELGFLTAATAGTATAGTLQQIRGWPVQPSGHTAFYNYTVEPTAYSVIAQAVHPADAVHAVHRAVSAWPRADGHHHGGDGGEDDRRAGDGVDGHPERSRVLRARGVGRWPVGSAGRSRRGRAAGLLLR
jgi:hypothetical protein